MSKPYSASSDCEAPELRSLRRKSRTTASLIGKARVCVCGGAILEQRKEAKDQGESFSVEGLGMAWDFRFIVDHLKASS